MIAAALALTLGAAAAEHGVLLLAHGGDAGWNREVGAVRDRLAERAPTELAIGMADRDALQRAVLALQRVNVKRIVAVPLFVHSRSEVLDQTRYLLGLRERPSEILREAMAHAVHGNGRKHSFSSERVAIGVPIAMTAALDDHPLVAEILLERAAKLSRTPGHETVLLVGHGPVDDKANEEWLKTMGRLCEQIKRRGGFKAASAYTLRDDSPPEVQRGAVEQLRQAVAAAGRDGAAIVLPHLIARGGIETHIVAALSGLSYRWDGRTLLPHPNIARWAEAAGDGR